MLLLSRQSAVYIGRSFVGNLRANISKQFVRELMKFIDLIFEEERAASDTADQLKGFKDKLQTVREMKGFVDFKFLATNQSMSPQL